MRKFALIATTLASVALSGCLGLSPATRGVAGLLPDYEIRQVPAVTCSEFLARIDPENTMSTASQRSALKVCEEMTAGAVVRPTEVQDVMRRSLIPGV